MSNPHSPEPSRWVLEMFAPDIPPWYRAFNELERKPLTASEDILVHSFDRYLHRKGYLTKRQVEVLENIATKHNVVLPLIPPTAHHSESTQLRQDATALLREIEEAETLAKWRRWGVPEQIVRKATLQRKLIALLKKVEEHVTIPNFAYPMPRLPDIEAKPWGFAKSIDFEGTIDTRLRKGEDKITRIDKWLYRYEYQRPRISITTRTYQPTEEMANMMHISLLIEYPYDTRLKRRAIQYSARAYGRRAVRICHLIEPYLTHPDKKRKAREILTTYKKHPMIRIL